MSFPQLTTDEVRQAAVQVVGHVLNLHGFWAAYRKLFRGNADLVPVIRETASEFFWLLERSLRAATLQTFRQLTDPSQTGPNPNASFHGLLRAAAGEQYATDHADMVALIEIVKSKPTIRDHVNKYIAHLDLELLAGRVDPPGPIAILEVEDALGATRQFMDTFAERFLGEDPFDYEGKAAEIPAQIDRMIYLLKSGLESGDV
jgi:hypothetical protein